MDERLLLSPQFNPDLESLLNPQQGVPTAAPGSNNLNALIQTLIGGGARPQPTKRNPLQAIVEALAGAIATGTSQNPSATLSSQLQGVQDRRFAKEQEDKRRQQQLEALGLQLQVESMKDAQAEERQIRAEQRAEAATVRKSVRDQQNAVAEFNMQMAGKEKLLNIELTQSERLANIKNSFDLDILQRNQDYSRSLSEAEAKDKRIAKTADLALSLITYGVDAETSHTIARKFLNDERLDKAESAKLNRAVAVQQAASRRGSGGGGGGGGGVVGQKQVWTLMQKFAETPMVQLEDGTIVETSSLQTDPTGQKTSITGQKVVKELSPEDAARHAMDVVVPMMMGVRPKQQQQTQEVQIQGTPEKILGVQFDNMVQAYRKSGMSNEALLEEFKKYVAKNPEDKDVVNEAIIRNGLSGARKFQPKQNPNKAIMSTPEQLRGVYK